MSSRISLGIDDFKELINGGYYYVDKSLLIKDIIDYGTKVMLFLRPRRFGKTINLSMLRYFFDIAEKQNEQIFKHLAILKQSNHYHQHLGQYPLIFLTMKGMKGQSWQQAYAEIRNAIAKLYHQYRFLLSSELLESYEKDRFNRILRLEDNLVDYTSSLLDLSQYLCRYYDKPVYLLIDEYDTPIHSSYLNDYDAIMLDFMRKMLGNVLKDNPYLERGIVTGILQITKESLFSDLNNMDVHSPFSNLYAPHYGLIESEVIQLLRDFNLTIDIDKIRKWYDGYCFGRETHVYNPLSILKIIQNRGTEYKPYWVNTGDSSLISKTLISGKYTLKKDLTCLLSGDGIKKQIKEELSLQDVRLLPSSIWSLLVFSGYLTYQPNQTEDHNTYNLYIPNKEIHTAFETIIRTWFTSAIDENYLQEITHHLINGDIANFSELFEQYIGESLSYFDINGKNPESFYHAFVLGMLVHLRNHYQVKSNRESGLGRYDVILLPKDKKKRVVIIEFKTAKTAKGESLEKAAKNAVTQIIEHRYADDIRAENYNTILAVGIAFQGKQVHIQHQNL